MVTAFHCAFERQEETTMHTRKWMAAGALAAATLMTATAALAQTINFNVSMWLPPAHPLTKYGYTDWFQRVEKFSNGTLKPKLFYGSALLSPQDHLSGVRDGIAQVGWINGAYNPSDLPEDNMIFHLSFQYTDYFVGAFATTEINMLDAQMRAQWRKNNLVYLSGYSTPPYRLMCSSRITNLVEIKGKKLRSGGGALPEWAKSVGAVPVNVASSETYTGVEKGQLDCATNAIEDLRSRSYWDVAKHVTMTELGVFWTTNAANRDFWRKLTTAQRKAFLDATAETMVDTGIGYLKEADIVAEEAKGKNVNFYQPDAGLKKSIDDYKARAAQYAVTIGTEKFGIKDAGGLVSRFQKIAEKWEKLLSGVDRTDRAKLLALLKREVYDKVDPATYGLQ
jgi:TRAP-type C4-dicarboxylate transport system substrate-binding protein